MTVITNAALIVCWCAGLGATRVEYVSHGEDMVKAERASIPFRDDPATEPVARNYWRSGYDRGHLAPAADFTANRDALEATYLMSNIAPMVPSFNCGRWARIEDEARKEVRRRGTARIVTIPVYGETTNRCGTLTVPTAFLKCVYTGDVCVAAWCDVNTDGGNGK